MASALTSVQDWSDHSHLAMLRSAAPLYSAMGLFLTSGGMTFDVPVLWISILFTPTVILCLGTEPAL